MKTARALAIYQAVLEFDATCGSDYASRGPDAAGIGRIIEVAPWRARISPNCRRALVRRSETAVHDIVQLSPGTTLFELELFAEPQLAINLRGDDIDIYRFSPGEWEKRFGVDPGADTVPILPFIFADPKDPRWQAFIRSPDGQWPRPLN